SFLADPLGNMHNHFCSSVSPEDGPASVKKLEMSDSHELLKLKQNVSERGTGHHAAPRPDHSAAAGAL
ncbi:MAG: hypothetical protein ABF727_11890, partial [Gluconobacter oxydans]